MNGADALCDTLLANGVDTCFANPGTSEMHFVAALDRRPAMRCVLGLFEGVVTGAADGYARMAGKPAVTLLHLGPGLANGLANLHNARRGNTPMVNVVGDHAGYHLVHDAPLTSDIESLARPMSHDVLRVADAAGVTQVAARAVGLARTPPGRIATVILPADAAWNEAPETIAQAPSPAFTAVSDAAVRRAAEALRTSGETVLLLSGAALREGALATASRIAQATGAKFMAQQSNARMERGAGRTPVERVPYVVDKALATFAATKRMVLVGAKAPVAFFAYPGKPGSMLPADCEVLELAPPEADVAEALERLAEALGVPRSLAAQTSARTPAEGPGSGALDPAALIRAVAALSPEGAIWVDESVSAGRDFFALSHGAAPHDFLQLTGGAIGAGLPLATGAAVACPGRKVIALQADGSAMYTVQALWTQARERLDVVNVIFSNRRYAILHNELRMVGAGAPGENARRMLDLDDPALDWVALARGMGVDGVRATDARGFADVLRAALARPGPFLIEAVL